MQEAGVINSNIKSKKPVVYREEKAPPIVDSDEVSKKRKISESLSSNHIDVYSSTPGSVDNLHHRLLELSNNDITKQIPFSAECSSDSARGGKRIENIYTYLNEVSVNTIGAENHHNLTSLCNNNDTKREFTTALASIVSTANDEIAKEEKNLHALLMEYISCRYELLQEKGRMVDRLEKITDEELKQQEDLRKEMQLRRSQVAYNQSLGK